MSSSYATAVDGTEPRKGGNVAKDDAFLCAVRSFDRVTLGEAKRYAASLPPDQQGVTGCYRVHCLCPCCPQCALGFACPMQCCGRCLWTPGFFFGLDAFISLCFCVCKENRGNNSCVDMKGNTYALLKVDAENDTLAWFSSNECCDDTPDAAAASIYCTKHCGRR
jgi:hypothetical protein